MHFKIVGVGERFSEMANENTASGGGGGACGKEGRPVPLSVGALPALGRQQPAINQVPWLLLVGSLVSRSEAMCHIKNLILSMPVQDQEDTSNPGLMLHALLANIEQTPRSCCRAFFIDRTGVMPCELAYFKWNQINSNMVVCLAVWNLVSASRSTNDDNTWTRFSYLEVTSPPIPLTDTHFLLKWPGTSFSSSDFDIMAEAFWNDEREALFRKYPPFRPVDRKKYTGGAVIAGDGVVKDGRVLPSINQQMSINGVVKAKSSLLQNGEKKLYFLLNIECDINSLAPAATDCQIDSEPSSIVSSSSSSSPTAPQPSAEEWFVIVMADTDRTEEILNWHNWVSPGRQYLLTDLTAVKIRQGEVDDKHMLLLNPKNSHLFQLDSSSDFSFAQHLSHRTSLQNDCENNSSNSNTRPLPVDDLFIRNAAEFPIEVEYRETVVSYCGRITRVIDACIGYYELDNNVHLFSMYCDRYSDGLGFRVGAMLDVRNVHVVAVYEMTQRDRTGHLARSPLPLVFLSTCELSSVKVVEFSPLVIRHPCRMYHRAEQRAQLKRLGNLSALAIIFINILRYSIQRKFKSLNWSSAAAVATRGVDEMVTGENEEESPYFKNHIEPHINQLVPVMEQLGYKAVQGILELSAYSNFMNHDASCLVHTDLLQSRRHTPFLPRISCFFHTPLFRLILDKTVREAEACLQSDAREYLARVFTLSDLGLDGGGKFCCWLVGVLVENGAGDYSIKDDSGSVLAHVIKDFECTPSSRSHESSTCRLHHHHLNKMCAVNKFEVVLELCGQRTDSIPSTASSPTTNSTCQHSGWLSVLKKFNYKLYVRFTAKDIVYLESIPQSQPCPIYRPVSGSFVLLNLVTHKAPLHLRIGQSNEVHTDGWIHGISWLVQLDDQIGETGSLFNARLISEARISMAQFAEECTSWFGTIRVGEFYAFNDPFIIRMDRLVNLQVLQSEHGLGSLDDEIVFKPGYADPPGLVLVADSCAAASGGARGRGGGVYGSSAKAVSFVFESSPPSSIDMFVQEGLHQVSMPVMGIKEVNALSRSSKSPSALTEPLNFEKLVTVEGVLILKDIREEDNQQMISDPSLESAHLFRAHGIGCGKSNCRVFVRLRDTGDFSCWARGSDGSSFEECAAKICENQDGAPFSKRQSCIDVYLDLKMVTYPMGMITGSVVRLSKCLFKVSKSGNSYLTSTPITSVQCTSFGLYFSPRSEEKLPSSVDSKVAAAVPVLISDVYFNNITDLVSVSGRLRFVRCMEIFSLCKLCFSEMRQGSCPFDCLGGISLGSESNSGINKSHFSVRMECYIEDGSAGAQLRVDNFQCAQALLGLSSAGSGKCSGIAGKHYQGLWQTVLQSVAITSYVKAEVPWFFEKEDDAIVQGRGEEEEEEEDETRNPFDRTSQYLTVTDHLKSIMRNRKIFRQMSIVCKPRDISAGQSSCSLSPGFVRAAKLEYLMAIDQYRVRDYSHDYMQRHTLYPSQITLDVVEVEEQQVDLEIRRLLAMVTT